MYLFFCLLSASCIEKEASNEYISIKCTVSENSDIFDTPTDNSQLKFKYSGYDFGSTQRGKILTVIFPFTNVGQKSIKIEEITGVCGCLDIQYPQHDISPEDRDTIFLNFDTQSYVGIVSKEVYIFYNSFQGFQKITIHGVIEK